MCWWLVGRGSWLGLVVGVSGVCVRAEAFVRVSGSSLVVDVVGVSSACVRVCVRAGTRARVVGGFYARAFASVCVPTSTALPLRL